MTPETYKELLKDLQKREKTLVPAYLSTLRADPALTAHLQVRFAVAEVGGRFDDFAMLCCRRSAVQFLLRTVYVRVLEDLGALDPPRIRGDWGFAAFREVAPALGVREFFKWTFRDLARDLPALFTPSPDELPLPSEDLCREVWDLWHRMSGDKPVYAWTSDTFDSHFLGNLYQDLDAEVRKRFALLQTPDFVEKYILDHTLTPALKEFDPAKLRADGQTFRIIDPTCGSGHFLGGAFHRLADYWQARGVEDPWEAAQRALESVWGCDINPHAVDVARFRLMLEVRARTGVTQLEKLAKLTFNLRAMDSLIPWERGATNQGELFPAMDRLSIYATPGERTANASFLSRTFHVVVGNPPYITPKDPQKRKDYKIFWPTSCHKNYALAAPFVERFFDLGKKGAFIGQITANSFMKRQFGTKLVETVLPRLDLTDIIDTSGAYIPGHGTPTLILFGRHQAPQELAIRTILGKRGEPKRPPDPSRGLVWQAIEHAPSSPSDENLYITVTHSTRESYSKHPWSLGGGFAATLKEMIESPTIANCSLEQMIESAGLDIITRASDLVEMLEDEARRVQLSPPILRTYLIGDEIRDFSAIPRKYIPVPYDDAGKVIPIDQLPALARHLWPHRSWLAKRFVSGGTRLCDVGLPHHALPQYPAHKHKTKLSITFASISTHNHFVIDRGGGVFKQTAPILKLRPDASLDDHANLCGLLNSSLLGFWMRQIFYPKGGDKKGDGARSSAEEWSDRLAYDASGLLKAPLVEGERSVRVALMLALDSTARDRADCLPQAILKAGEWTPSNLDATLAAARERYRVLTHRMVALQEELDWLTYSSYQVIDPVPVVAPADIEPLAPGHRPFEILFARADDEADDEEKSAWWSRHGHDRVTEIPFHYSEAVRARIQARMDLIEGDPKLQLIEQAACKRRWQTPDFDSEAKSAAESYLLDRLEDLFAPSGPLANPTPYRLEQIVDAWARGPKTVAVARVWKGGDVDLTLAAEQLLRAHGLPDNPRRIYTVEGLRTLAAWKKTWYLQDLEDQGKPLVDPDTGKPLDTIEIPPKFERGHFQSADAFSIRGKLNVPRERFIIFTDLIPPRYGWNGWRDTERARAQVDAYDLAEKDPDNRLPPPTVANPRRCGPTLGLWECLPDVRRWDDESTHAELLALAQEVCGQKSCPCDVVDAWQAWQDQEQKSRGKKAGRKASLPIVTSKHAPPTPSESPAEPEAIAVTIEHRGYVFRLIESFGESGATISDLSKQWTREPGHLARVLDDLIASGDLKTRGRGKKKIYIAASTSRTPET